MERNSASQAFVLVEEFLHLFGISRKDDNNLVAVVLHHLNYGVYRFRTVGIVLVNKGVRLVDKEDTASCRTEFLFNGFYFPFGPYVPLSLSSLRCSSLKYASEQTPINL